MKMKIIYFSVCFLLYSISASAEFAQLISISHDCGSGVGGSVEFELNGNENDFTYFWEHGPTSLNLEGLTPGTYTLFVENFYGCIEEYEVEILSLSSCSLNAQVLYPITGCEAAIEIVVFTDGGQIIEEEALNIQWTDGDPAGLIRPVPLGASELYCVDIELIGGSSCCSISDCIQVYASPNCSEKCNEILLVNEFSRNKDSKGQFIEILVSGKCDCEANTDIRGTIIDDNNGTLIPGNDLVSEFNAELSIGANTGYLLFSHHPNWQSVPNGSLIVIYDKRDGSIPGLPADDPTDINQDNVYVLSANDNTYFQSKTGSWDSNSKSFEYSGFLESPSWDKINISSPADGVQLRKSDGSYQHGLAKGNSSFTTSNTFPLWISDSTINQSNCQLTDADYKSATSFSCYEADQLLQTPGVANSAINGEFINSLKDCNVSPPLLHDSDGSIKYSLNKNNDLLDGSFESLEVFPNPFHQQINLSFTTQNQGKSTIKLFTISGKEIMKTIQHAPAGSNNIQLDIPQTLPAGIFILEFTFPSGNQKSTRLTHFSKK